MFIHGHEGEACADVINPPVGKIQIEKVGCQVTDDYWSVGIIQFEKSTYTLNGWGLDSLHDRNSWRK